MQSISSSRRDSMPDAERCRKASREVLAGLTERGEDLTRLNTNQENRPRIGHLG